MIQPTKNTTQHTQIIAVGQARGSQNIDNHTLAPAIDSSDEWIKQRTGIITRARATKDQSTYDLAVEAAKDALQKANLEGSEIDLIIIATVSNPSPTPSLASKLSAEIGAIGAAAYDISAACAGYTYAVAQADALIKTGTATKALVIGAEKLSEYISPTDRTISFLLGDGAGAVIITQSETPKIGPTIWGSDGTKWDAIGLTNTILEYRDSNQTIDWPTLRQDGQSVFKWAVWEMAKIAKQAIEASGITAQDLAAFIPHQANMRIIDEFAKQLKLPETVTIARDIATTGNTSAASIPLAMGKLLEEKPELSGKLALQIGFGAGLVFGAQIITLP